jgi:hypothetical protein
VLLAAHVSTNVRRAQSLRATSILSTPTFALTAVHAQMFALLAQSLRANNPTKNNKKRRVSRGSPFFCAQTLHHNNPSQPKSGKHTLPYAPCLSPSRARTFIIYIPTAPPLEFFLTSALVFFQCRGHIRALWQKLLFVKIHRIHTRLFFSPLRFVRTKEFLRST